jgi:hypothetical protein
VGYQDSVREWRTEGATVENLKKNPKYKPARDTRLDARYGFRNKIPKKSSFLLVEPIDVAALIQLANKALVGEVLGLGRLSLGLSG